QPAASCLKPEKRPIPLVYLPCINLSLLKQIFKVMIRLERTDSDNKDFRYLVSFLDEDLAERDGDDHSFYAQFNKVDLIKNVVIAYNDNIPVGCGAFKLFSDGIAEVKRMYVLPEHRNK